MKWAYGTLALLACGTRTELGALTSDADVATPPVICHPGDPPAVLATTGGSGPLATDGAFVYGSSSAEVLWGVRAAGGERTSLLLRDDARASSAGGLTAANDGVYANIFTTDPSSPEGEDTVGAWLRHDGLATRTVHAGVFAPPAVYFWGGGQVQMAPLDGSSGPLGVVAVSTPTDVAGVVGLTSGKLYVQSPLYSDCYVFRIDRSTAAVESFNPHVPNFCGSVGAVSGPNAVCGYFGCMLDEQVTPMILHDVLALDATYAYASREDGLHRIELRGDGDDVVTRLKATGVAVANGCVYVQTDSELVRIAAPP